MDDLLIKFREDVNVLEKAFKYVCSRKVGFSAQEFLHLSILNFEWDTNQQIPGPRVDSEWLMGAPFI